jgi:Raf kinase inhibitor-like YbhB/YbcL family protein
MAAIADHAAAPELGMIMMLRTIVGLAVVAALFSTGAASAEDTAPAPAIQSVAPASGAPASVAKIRVASPAFKANGTLPEIFTQNGKNQSPPLSWTKGPKGTRSYVLLVEDTGVKRPEPISHWVAYDIPATVTALPAGLPTDAKLAKPAGALQGLNIRKTSGYMGPKPPMGATHPYHFEVFALDAALGLDPAAADRNAVVAAMAGHVLASGEIVASYQTPQPPYDRHDLTGVWLQLNPGAGFKAKDIAFTPEYAQIYQDHMAAIKAGVPYRHDQGVCLPRGLVGSMTTGIYPFEILYRGDGEILVNKETPGNLYRIFLKRGHKPADELFPTFYGDSVGHWEGDVLVVDTISLGAGDTLDAQIPNSDALHVIQRLQRVTYDTIENQVTIDDAKAYARPATVTVTYKLQPGWELAEAVCTNERNVLNDKGESTIKADGGTK